MPLKTLPELVAELRPSVKEIDTEQLAQLMADDKLAPIPTEGRAILIDVREDRERVAGYIPRSAHLGRGVLERDIAAALFNNNVTEDDLNTPIICYCRGGQRSVFTADMLNKMGFTDVTSVAGGFRAWTQSGHPVQQD